jgi:DNA-binding transcriptional LysR family regulator
MMEMAEEMQSEINREEQTRGSLVIRIPETLATFAMPSVVEEFQEQYPLVSLRFINCSDQQLKQELNTGRLDIAFLITDSITIEEVDFEILGYEELVLVTAPSHPLSTRREVLPKDLDGKTLLLPRTD